MQSTKFVVIYNDRKNRKLTAIANQNRFVAVSIEYEIISVFVRVSEDIVAVYVSDAPGYKNGKAKKIR
jgi:hypothetical protein